MNNRYGGWDMAANLDVILAEFEKLYQKTINLQRKLETTMKSLDTGRARAPTYYNDRQSEEDIKQYDRNQSNIAKDILIITADLRQAEAERTKYVREYGNMLVPLLEGEIDAITTQTRDRSMTVAPDQLPELIATGYEPSAIEEEALDQAIRLNTLKDMKKFVDDAQKRLSMATSQASSSPKPASERDRSRGHQMRNPDSRASQQQTATDADMDAVKKALLALEKGEDPSPKSERKSGKK